MISTKNIDSGSGGSSVPKTLAPGVHTFKINSIVLDEVPYKKGAYNMNLNVEGPDMGEDFEGFFIDKDDPTQGRYKGQVGRVRFSEFPYADGETKSGIIIKRDDEILKAVNNICKALSMQSWLESQDNKHDTIQSLVSQLNADKPFTGKYLRACVAGREYQNKQGYTNHDLYLPKWSKEGLAYESADVEEALSKVVKFNNDVHIKKSKTDTVQSFGDATPTTSNVAGDFEL
jgi:hypothetical protein